MAASMAFADTDSRRQVTRELMREEAKLGRRMRSAMDSIRDPRIRRELLETKAKMKKAKRRKKKCP